LFEVKKSISKHPFITLIGGNDLVPHAQIFKAIAAADFGIICYPQSAHIENRIPTKLYEYLACRLPIILQDYEPWIAICNPYQAGLIVQFNDYQPEEVLKKMATTSFYVSLPTDVTWESEEAFRGQSLTH
jgi:hypothetical protein